MNQILRRMSRPPTRHACLGRTETHRPVPARPARASLRTTAAGATPASEPSTPTQLQPPAQAHPTPPPPSTHPSPAVPPVASAAVTADLPYYSQFPLDRHAEWRRDAPKLDELFARPDAKLVPLIRDMVLVRPGSGPDQATGSDAAPTEAPPSMAAAPLLRPVLLCPAAQLGGELTASSPARVFLGTDAAGAPYFAAAVDSPVVAKDLAAANPGAEWRSARAAGPDMAPGDASLLAVASGLMVWHGGNGFSAATGAPSVPSPGGFSRKCTAGGGSAYPRIDPAVIMLVTHGEFGLLGRKAEWPVERYSTLAGFLELGEPLELAVARETEEEAGVQVDLSSVTYCASQPWPFPRSLMVGFTARAAGRPVAPASSISSLACSPTFASSSSSNGTGAAAAAYSPPSVAPAGGRSEPGPAPRVWWQPAAATASGFDLLPLEARRAALDVGIFREEVEEALRPLQDLQWPVPDTAELQDARWFHRDWLRAVFRNPGGAAAVPGAGAFNIPGPYSLAYRLITGWVGCASISNGSGGATAAAAAWPAGECVPQVLISGSGTFKYVLMRLWDPRPEAAGRSKLLVWGDTRAPYHNDVLQKAKAMARPLGLQVTPLGGGRMEHDPVGRRIQVYGYSAAFGPAPHEVAAALLHRWYPLYDKESISVSYEGY